MESLLILQFIFLIVPNSSYENLSRRNTTLITQSSSYHNRNVTLANDGVKATTDFKCAHTALNHAKAWLQVDLGTPFRIRSVVIYYRKEGDDPDDWKQYRFRQFYLDVSDLPVTQTTTAERTRCYTDNTTYPNLPPNIITIPCKQTARYVIVETTYDAPEDDPYNGAVLEICEIQVKGCDATHYGADCSQVCSVNCIQQSCNITSGSCSLGCKTGYYGEHCSKICGGCQAGCHRHTGECEGACPIGKFGAHCERTCSQTCEGGCTKTSGVCTRCTDGWYGDTCNETCSAGCSLRCDQVDGNCTCKASWGGYDYRGCDDTHYGASCFYECNVNCIQQTCDISTGSCTHGCKTGFHGDHCSKICGDCLEGCHRHTGECEGACLIGKFGAHCERTCNKTCEGGCSKTSGVCTSCMDGWYGDMCEEICGAGCSLRCEKVDGNCTCKPGWEGYDCRGRSLKNTEREFTQYLVYVFAGLFCISLSLNVFITMRAKRCKQRTEESKNMEENQYQQIELADLNQVAVEIAEGKRVYENISENRDVCEMLHYETLQNSA
ncbi:uncharacterized protein LOC144624166 isoform X1 [Crassostrea virginica]